MIWPVGSFGAGGEIVLCAGDDGRQHVLFRSHRTIDFGDEIARDHVKHRREHRLLGGEVMIDGALRHLRGLRDIVDRGGGEAAIAEQPASRLQDRFRCRRAPFRLFRHRICLIEIRRSGQLTFRPMVGIYRLAVGLYE